MRRTFDEKLALLNNDLIEMGAMCEEVLINCVKALSGADTELLRKIIEVDKKIDAMEREIEDLCLKLLLHQQPVARDLRQISVALKIITDMERIGDQARDIAEIIPHLNNINVCEKRSMICQMAAATIKMVTESIDAFVKQDIGLAYTAIANDDIVDNYFVDVKKMLIDMIRSNDEDGEYALDLLMIAKYFERIGDHAVNIAEWVVFSVTGEHKGDK